MQLWSVVCCCCSPGEEVEAGLEGSERVTVNKPDFPRIVIQEPTPLVLRKESEIADKEEVEEEEEEEKEADIVTAKPPNQPADGEAKAPPKKTVARKVSIPILDLEMERSEANTGDDTGKVLPEPEVVVGQSSPESSSNLQTSHLESRRVSNVSTSSGWSWPTHHEEHQDTQNMLEVDKDGSRRYSHLPPAEINDPLATKVEGSKFVKIPHPGK